MNSSETTINNNNTSSNFPNGPFFHNPQSQDQPSLYTNNTPPTTQTNNNNNNPQYYWPPTPNYPPNYPPQFFPQPMIFHQMPIGAPLPPLTPTHPQPHLHIDQFQYSQHPSPQFNQIQHNINIHHNNGNHLRSLPPKKKFSVNSVAFKPKNDHASYLKNTKLIRVEDDSSINVEKAPTQKNTEEEKEEEEEEKKEEKEKEKEEKEEEKEIPKEIETKINGKEKVPLIEKDNELEYDGIRFISNELSVTDFKTPLIIDPTNSTVTTVTNSQKNTEFTNGVVKGLIFTVEEVDTSLPLVFNTTLESLLAQKRKFKVQEENIDQTGEQELQELQHEEEEEEGEEDEEHKNLQNEEVEDVVGEPASNEIIPDPVTIKSSAFSGWSAIAQQGAQKFASKSVSLTTSTTSSPKASIGKKDEIKLVPTISNVLEPLGTVLIRLMFDKSFQNHHYKTKLPKLIPRGIINTGNICFMSSILQLLLYCEPFYQMINIVANKTMGSISNSKTPLFDSITTLFKEFTAKTDDYRKFGDSIMPTDFYKSISTNERFQHLKWGQQEDAEEFFGYLLDGLHEEFISSISKLNELELKNLLNSIIDDDLRNLIKQNLKKYNDKLNNSFNDNDELETTDGINEDESGWLEVGSYSKLNKKIKKSAKRTVEIKPSPITQLFGGSFRSILNIPGTLENKSSQSITLDPFQQIQLDISSNDVKTVEDAFKKISEVEEIPYKSNKIDVLAKKQTFIDKLPQILVIHLKRFSFGNLKQGKVEKILKKIEYSHNLKIPIDIISPSIRKFENLDKLNYKLTGVVYHIGKNPDGGHYTSDVLHKNEWLRIDDTSIIELKPDEVLEGDDESVKSAYILMYQRI